MGFFIEVARYCLQGFALDDWRFWHEYCSIYFGMLCFIFKKKKMIMSSLSPSLSLLLNIMMILYVAVMCCLFEDFNVGAKFLKAAGGPSSRDLDVLYIYVCMAINTVVWEHIAMNSWFLLTYVIFYFHVNINTLLYFCENNLCCIYILN